MSALADTARAQPFAFVELLARSNFSFLQGASHPEEMVQQARTLGYRGLGLCDLNGLYGVVRGFQAAHHPSAFDTSHFHWSKEPFHYIMGAELTLTDHSPLVLMPLNETGYINLCRLITQAKRPIEKGFSHLCLNDVIERNAGLLVFPLPPWNVDKLVHIGDNFGDRLYLPVWKSLTWQSLKLYHQALDLEKRHGFELFATQRPMMHIPERKPLLDVLTCIHHKTTLEDAVTRLHSNSENYLHTLDQLTHLWHDRPDLLEKTFEIAQRVGFRLDQLHYEYPRDYLPTGKTAAEFLRIKVEEGLRWRFPDGTPAKVRAQVESEMTLIHELGYEDYFLTLWDVCEYARTEQILFQGRGSAANSVVCYALGLTNASPLKINMLFERFLSRERGEPPDIDIDFEHDRREEVIQYIYRKYGNDHAAMVSTIITYRSRMALREVAKVLGVPPENVQRMVRFMGREGLSHLLKNPERMQAFGLTEFQFQQLVRLSLELKGFPRHVGIHTGGFVISHRPIPEIVPIEKATMEGRYVVQWNKDDLNTLRLMKIDVLALGMLSAVRRSLDLLREHKGIDWSLAQIPEEDAETYQMIQKADTIGVFQIESRAQMSLLPRLKPACYYDLVIEVAIVRPGPIQGGMVHPFLRRREGLEKVEFPHPALKDILQSTLGVPIFQEQIMRIAVEVAGFTPGEADELRRIMASSWTRKLHLEGVRRRIIDGLISRGLTLEYAQRIYQTIEGFSAYGFPESHAASFALITYASCYLKHHHPEVFVCALLNSQPMGFYSPRALIADAQRHGVEFLPIDVCHSEVDCTLESVGPEAEPTPGAVVADSTNSEPRRWAVRLGLRSIYGLTEKDKKVVVQERQRRGRYTSLQDFVVRTRLSSKILIRLCLAGALDSLGVANREILWLLQELSTQRDTLLFPAANTAAHTSDETALASQSGILISTKAASVVSLIPEESDWQAMEREYQMLGFSLDRHPFALLRSALEDTNQRLRAQRRHPFLRALDIQNTYAHQRQVRVAGLVSILQRPPTAKGVSFITLEDETGQMNLVLYPAMYQKYRDLIAETPFLWCYGTLQVQKGTRNIQVQKMGALPVEQLARGRPTGESSLPIPPLFDDMTP